MPKKPKKRLSTKELRSMLDKARTAFQAAGGRGVDLAEEIDWLERELARRDPRFGKPPKEVKFKLKYLREIVRNACLHATQPKEQEYGALCETPAEILGRMVVTLRDVHKMVYEAFVQKIELDSLKLDTPAGLRALSRVLKKASWFPNLKELTKAARSQLASRKP